MKLRPWTDKDADTSGDFRDDMTHERQLAYEVIEIFEQLLNKNRMVIPDPDRSDPTPGTRSTGEIGPIYGTTYDTLESDVAETIENYLSKL